MLLLVVLALAVAACSSGGSSNATSSTPAKTANAPASQAAGQSQGAAESQAAVESQAAESQSTSGGLVGANKNFSKIKSYKFTMVFKGGSYGSMLGSAPIKGTVVTEPAKAAYMSVMGMEIVEVGGKTYVKMGTSWIESTDKSTSSMADDFAPEKMFGSYVDASAASGYKASGEGQKNGVQCVHYVADASILNSYGSMLGVTGNATWSADVWVAKDAGYPVSMSIKATGGSEDFEFSMDITNVNDPANKVEAPI